MYNSQGLLINRNFVKLVTKELAKSVLTLLLSWLYDYRIIDLIRQKNTNYLLILPLIFFLYMYCILVWHNKIIVICEEFIHSYLHSHISLCLKCLLCYIKQHWCVKKQVENNVCFLLMLLFTCYHLSTLYVVLIQTRVHVFMCICREKTQGTSLLLSLDGQNDKMKWGQYS